MPAAGIQYLLNFIYYFFLIFFYGIARPGNAGLATERSIVNFFISCIGKLKFSFIVQSRVGH